MNLRLRTIRFFQTSFTWFAVQYVRSRGDVTVTMPFTIHPDRRYLFVANHQSQLDAFAVFAGLSYQQMRDVGPTRFMTAGYIYYSWLFPLVFMCGCYPTRKKSDPGYDPVDQSIYYLGHGQNVFIFPEGKINLQSESQPRMGVKRIFDGTQTPFTLVLIHLEWSHVGNKRRNLRVVFAEASEVTSPESLMEQLYRL